MNVQEQFDALAKKLEDGRADVAKAQDGQHAAATRVRKLMMDVKKSAQDIRVALSPSKGE